MRHHGIQHFAALRWGARHLDIAELHAVLRKHWDIGPERLPEPIEELVRDLFHPEQARLSASQMARKNMAYEFGITLPPCACPLYETREGELSTA